MPSVPGTYQLTDWVAPKTLWLMKNSLEALSFASFDYQKEFESEQYAPGDTIRVKLPQMFNVVDGFDYQPQAIDRRSTSLTIDQPMQIPFEWDSIEEALKLERSKSQIESDYMEPAAYKLAQEADSRFMLFVKNTCPNINGALGTTPTSWATYAGAMTRMVENAGINGRIGMLLTPQMMETFISNNLASNFNPADEISRQYKKGIVGMAAGAEWYRIMSCRAHTTGKFTTVLSSTTVNAAGQSGSSITVAMTTGDTLKLGDTITFATSYQVNPWTLISTGRLKQFKITQDVTAAASVATLSIDPPIIGPGSPYQNVNALPALNDIVTISPGTTMTDATTKSGIYGAALCKGGYLAAGVKLYIPKEGGPVEIARQMTDPASGMHLAFIRQFEPTARKVINRFDMLFGMGKGYFDRSACLIAGLQ